MIDETNLQVDEKNRWRLETPGHDGWQRTARPGDSNRHLLISADCHVNEPSKLWWERIDANAVSTPPKIAIAGIRGHGTAMPLPSESCPPMLSRSSFIDLDPINQRHTLLQRLPFQRPCEQAKIRQVRHRLRRSHGSR